MCKVINPCICIPSGFASFLVAITDIALGVGTLYYSWLSLDKIEVAKEHLRKTNTKDDVLLFGIVSIPLVAFIGVWSGLKLIWGLCGRSEESNHKTKFVVFFLGEVIGFAAPFYIFEDYVSKIRTITSFDVDARNFMIFHLLDINRVTISLFVYQILSFWVVHRHQLLAKEKREDKKRRKSATIKPEPKPIDGFSVIDETSKTAVVQKKPDEPRIKTNSTKSKVLYPDLNELRLEDLPEFRVARALKAKNDTVVELSPSRIQKSAKTLSKFELLRQKCLSTRTLYVDEEFPATPASIGSGKRYEWKRPHEIQKKAQFFTDGVSRFDVRQGSLGNCWFIASVGNLTLYEELFEKVVPSDNEWAGDENEIHGYAGICHFRFWIKHEWKEVIIDDRLPTQNGNLVFLHSTEKTEFWSPLLEKAYAKLHGCYANLDGNDGMGRAFKNFTGGRVIRHHIDEFLTKTDRLFQLINEALLEKKMVGCCIMSAPAKRTGLYGSHAYSLTHANKIQMTDGSKVSALRIRNPWGNANEWKGRFSDSHPIWESVDKKTRVELQIIFTGDGEFWVPLDDFVKYFHFVEICHL